ncbi:MAG: hypothetical protein WA326_10285 [Nitrososphaeraceae archaeon]
MTSITLSIATSLLVVTLLTSVGHFANTSFAQGNQTNQSGGGGGQQNQSGIGTASQMENLTSGNTDLLQNASDIGSQNTSVTGGMEQEQEATEATSPASTQQQGNQTGEAAQTAMNKTGEAGQAALNETGEALTNASKSDVAQNISQGGQEIGQTVANETGDIFGSISEGLKGLFGGGS